MTRTAKAIRAALSGSGRVYVREVLTDSVRRVFDARERKGELQVKTSVGWHALLLGDELFETEA